MKYRIRENYRETLRQAHGTMSEPNTPARRFTRRARGQSVADKFNAMYQDGYVNVNPKKVA